MNESHLKVYKKKKKGGGEIMGKNPLGKQMVQGSGSIDPTQRVTQTSSSFWAVIQLGVPHSPCTLM